MAIVIPAWILFPFIPAELQNIILYFLWRKGPMTARVPGAHKVRNVAMARLSRTASLNHYVLIMIVCYPNIRFLPWQHQLHLTDEVIAAPKQT